MLINFYACTIARICRLVSIWIERITQCVFKAFFVIKCTGHSCLMQRECLFEFLLTCTAEWILVSLTLVVLLMQVMNFCNLFLDFDDVCDKLGLLDL